MSWAYAGMTRKPWRVLAWSALMAITLLLALLLQALAAGSLVETGPSAPAATCLSSAGAALADDRNVRESFLAHLCRGATGLSSMP